jgi:hypothetical protein
MSPAARRGFSFVLPGSRPMIALDARSVAVPATTRPPAASRGVGLQGAAPIYA